MSEITLARIDDRLVHGQVMQVWTKGKGTNSAYVIDDATANDEFMKEIYESTQSTGGLKIKVFSAQGLVDQWNADQFGDDKVALIFKSLAYAKVAVDGGVPIKELNVGGIAIKPARHPAAARGHGPVLLLPEEGHEGHPGHARLHGHPDRPGRHRHPLSRSIR